MGAYCSGSLANNAHRALNHTQTHTDTRSRQISFHFIDFRVVFPSNYDDHIKILLCTVDQQLQLYSIHNRTTKENKKPPTKPNAKRNVNTII